MRRLMLATAALSLAVAGNALAAAPCKDAKGKFIKCPPPAAKPAAVRCKDGKGKFAKCGTPGAIPM